MAGHGGISRSCGKGNGDVINRAEPVGQPSKEFIGNKKK